MDGRAKKGEGLTVLVALSVVACAFRSRGPVRVGFGSTRYSDLRAIRVDLAQKRTGKSARATQAPNYSLELPL